MTLRERQFAIIAGSGFRDFGVDAEGKLVDTPFGPPSGPVRALAYAEQVVFLLPRHGDDLLIPPHRINYRANMQALKMLGVEAVIAMNTVGVINANLHPGQIAIPDQLIDYTWGREHSIYEGVERIDHIDFTQPLTESLRQDLLKAADDVGVDIYDGGVYAATQGPRLETAAEVDRIERDGADFIGMTAMPEAALARELKLDYACLSLIVNYAAGRGNKPIHDDLEAATVTAKMQAMRVLRLFFGVMEE